VYTGCVKFASVRVNDQVFKSCELKAATPFDKIYCIEVIEDLYEYQVADAFSLFYKLTNSGGQLFLTTPNYGSAWPLIEWLPDRFALVATLDQAQDGE